jgi:hypothetical protein
LLLGLVCVPGYLLRDGDSFYGEVIPQKFRVLGIGEPIPCRLHPTAPNKWWELRKLLANRYRILGLFSPTMVFRSWRFVCASGPNFRVARHPTRIPTTPSRREGNGLFKSTTTILKSVTLDLTRL